MTIYKLTDFTGNMFSVNKPNLLLNSDFRDPINPRGQTIYTGGKTIACWKLATDSDTLTINDGYITVTGSGMRQYLDIAISDTFILSVKYKEESDMVHFIFENFDGTYVDKVISGHKCGIEFSTSTNKMIVYFWNNGSSENYEYAKLSEGNIITPYEKEDKAIAQMRCEKHVLKLPTSYSGYTGSTSYIYFVSEKLMGMASTPSVDVIPTTIRCVFEGGVTAYNISNITVNKASGEINVQVTSPPSSLASKSIGGWFDKNIILSCEP